MKKKNKAPVQFGYLVDEDDGNSEYWSIFDNMVDAAYASSGCADIYEFTGKNLGAYTVKTETKLARKSKPKNAKN